MTTLEDMLKKRPVDPKYLEEEVKKMHEEALAYKEGRAYEDTAPEYDATSHPDHMHEEPQTTMQSITPEQLTDNIQEHITTLEKAPIALTMDGKRKAVLVKPEFYERALDAIGDLEFLKRVEEQGGIDEIGKLPGRPLHEVMEELDLR
ncbi:hypothetical protein ACFP6B_09785 [Rothia nasimurium]|uniref:hypothetical protein n=1 Tax=Rothia nasimurium TaxID=85336 RepID=UPI00360654C6